MSEIVADPLLPLCHPLLSKPGIEEDQSLGPDLFLFRARGARALRQGKLRQPERPAGIPNPKRRVPDLAARPLSPQALSDLLDRKPHLLRPLAAQLLPPPLAAVDPVARLGVGGVGLSSLRTSEDCRQVLATGLEAVARGEIAPAEGARRARGRLRAVRRLARLAPVRA